MKTNWYVTFGQGQYLGLLKDHFVVIENAEYDQAMTVAREAFGQKFSALYVEETWTDGGVAARMEAGGPTLIELGRLDANGNRIRRNR